MTDWKLYSGRGARRTEPVPPAVSLDELTAPMGYIADEGVSAAVNIALALGQPLLVTGDPGTGKTQLAHSVAFELDLPLLVFNTKTTSTARDLFYRYDALRHFQDAQIRRDTAGADAGADSYIDYEALGLAILLAMEPKAAGQFLPEKHRGTGPRRSVVLIDEIDKAPRDLPNDLLNEVEEMRFTVRETGRSFSADRAFRPILVLTSNSEKNLPDAFLRRCVYFHVPVPTRERLEEIVSRRLGIALPPKGDAAGGAAGGNGTGAAPQSGTIVRNAVAHFLDLRDKPGMKKKPATAELISWTRMLLDYGLDVGRPLADDAGRVLLVSYSILAKTQEDLALMRGERTAAR
jgi:MoxR-like ATPase